MRTAIAIPDNPSQWIPLQHEGARSTTRTRRSGPHHSEQRTSARPYVLEDQREAVGKLLEEEFTRIEAAIAGPWEANRAG